MSAIDEFGKVLLPQICNVICPVEHIEEARLIAWQHQVYVEGHRPERVAPLPQILPTPLSPSGLLPATHYLCCRMEYETAIQKIIGTLTAAESNGWTVGRKLTLSDPVDLILSHFCQVIGDKGEMLKYLGLREIG